MNNVKYFLKLELNKKLKITHDIYNGSKRYRRTSKGTSGGYIET